MKHQESLEPRKPNHAYTNATLRPPDVDGDSDDDEDEDSDHDLNFSQLDGGTPAD